MRVSVCIVGFRNVEDIVRCLGALAGSTHTDFEVAICENGGAEACARLREALPAAMDGGQPVTVIEASGNLGYAGGVNVCLAATPDSDAWWVLNPDTEPQPEAMARLVERLAECDAVGGVVYDEAGVIDTLSGGHWTIWMAHARSIGVGSRVGQPVDQAAVERELSYISGACLMIGRSFLDAVGPMREDYFLYCEEVEWCLRARQLGLRLGLAPEAFILHRAGSTTGSAVRVNKRPKAPIYLDTRNRVLVTRDLYPARLFLAAPAVLAYMSLRCIRRGAWRQLGYTLAGWWAGVRNERGVPDWF
jgi:GT2 family glycosyltransferase